MRVYGATWCTVEESCKCTRSIPGILAQERLRAIGTICELADGIRKKTGRAFTESGEGRKSRGGGGQKRGGFFFF